MKKSIIVALALVSAFVISGCGGGDKKPATPPKPVAVQQTATFKEIGYYKSSSNQRSFCIYTNSKDKNEMIKYAQSNHIQRANKLLCISSTAKKIRQITQCKQILKPQCG